MQEDMIVQPNTVVKLENYKFSGLDASLVGAIKSVADYYQLPLTTSWIYGMTGIAFLHILDENMCEPNGGPLEPEVFVLARNLGVDIEGYHIHAEGETFTQLQAEAWEKAREVINAGQPVFAKNIDIGNQSSVILAYDDQGYYTDNWHTGYEHSDDVIPWNQLGLSLCPCINCVHDRESSDTQTADSTSGLISLHWATSIPVARENQAALKEALEFVIQLNEIGSYRWSGKTYFVGSHAYDRWLTALESQQLDKYFFSLFVEIITEARHHAAQFLSEIRASMTNLNLSCLDQLILTYTEITAKGKVLKDMYPYTEPRTQILEQSEQCAVLLIELQALESKALIALRELHSSL